MQRYYDNGTLERSLTIDSSNINYPKLKGNKYKMTDENTKQAWINVEDRKTALKQLDSSNG